MDKFARRYGNVRVLAILALACFVVPSSWGRLGETFDQVQGRYGLLVKVDNVTRPDCPQYFFQKDGMEIRVRFVNGKSAQEIFSASSSDMRNAAAEILSSNAEGSTWSSIAVGKSTEYIRADGKATAQYLRPKKSEHGDRPAVLQIQTLEFNRAFNPDGVQF